ncbi:hypothetical protein [Flavobacterium phycosphaerae]|uniref:hypothetical protein n=1 Tax=Flavobacterium phycosphaerae TaxID=2697515 RepID=UPI001389A1CC|nr:hypothetical protein [Flavobacterium phycosphaerae]
MKTRNLILGLALSLSILSCSKDDSNDNGTVSADDAKASAKIDAMNDDVTNIVEEQESNTYLSNGNGKTTQFGNSMFSDCATITLSTPPPYASGDTVTKTIDFGTTGCTLNNGNVLKGKIIISFVYQPTATSHTITYTFENFYHNAIKFDGTKTFTRVIIAANGNVPAHPKVTMNMDMTATFPNGDVYHRTGERVREIIEGIGNDDFSDNVYRITGNWLTTGPNGGTQTSTITTELHVKMSCIAVHKPLIVSGVITIVRGNNTATLDYGNGACDNLAVLTVNGNNSFDIVIGN